MREWFKYLLRSIGITSLLLIVSLVFSGILYGIFFKLIVAIIVAEIIWVLWFKPVFGAMESFDNLKFIGLAILRGMLISACILGACLGL